MAVRHIEIKPFSWVHPQLALISRCNLDIYMGKTNAVVVASQIEDSQDAGITVTDGAVLIASTVMNKYGFSVDRLVWIEHYPPGTRGPDTPGATHERLWFARGDTGLRIERRCRIGAASLDALVAEPDIP